MRPVNPATVHAVILSKKPMYNHIVDDTILHSGPRSSLLTRGDRRIVATASAAAIWALTFLSLNDDSLMVIMRERKQTKRKKDTQESSFSFNMRNTLRTLYKNRI